ncbi:hypothetical protein ACVR1I_03645 [Streptococcus cameli]
MAEIIEFKCPNCDGAIHFDSRLQKMKCPYCDAEIELESLRELDAALQELPASAELTEESQKLDSNRYRSEVEDNLQVYVCESCAGELITDSQTVATSCPYCDNPVVLKERVSGPLRPESLIPFQLSKEEAVAQLHQHVKGKRLLPKVFKDEQHINEIKGLYVPFWVFDTDASVDVRYQGNSKRMWSDGRYNYTEVNHFLLHRSAEIRFSSVPVDASSKIDNALIESIEPFDLTQAIDFQTAYLAGFLADRYDQDSTAVLPIANQRIQETIKRKMLKTVEGFNDIQKEAESIRLENANGKYILLPIWLLHTSWKNQSYLFAMNGQTGKFVGDLPLDKQQFWKYFLLVFLVVLAISLGISWLIYVL